MLKQMMLGNQALAQGAWEAGVKVVASYPGTPSTEITEYAAQYSEIEAQWSPNEKVAMEVAIGAAIAGARSMTCMKHVGMNVAADPMFTVAYSGINAGMVIVVADDPGIHSSQNEQDSRYYAKSAHIPMLEPSDSREALEFTKLAFDMSEKYDTPIIVRMTTRTSHAQGIVEVGDRADIALKDYTKDVDKYVMMPGMARKRRLYVLKREKELAEAASTMEINSIEYAGKDIGIICSGVAYQYVKDAMPEVSVLKLGMVYPLPDKLIRDFASNVKELYVAEELEPFLQDSIASMGINVMPRRFEPYGELSSNMVLQAFGKQTLEAYEENNAPMRPPVLCPGCPHRGTYHVVSKLKLYVTGDIGCYTLGSLPPQKSIDTCICMGASIGQALGMEKARGKDFARKLISVIGDSTFLHTGINGLMDMVYNGATSTVLILDNRITGMTGHQQNPSTGKTLKNQPTHAIDIEALCSAMGVPNVRVCDPFDIEGLELALTEELERESLSVIIARRECALLIKPKAALRIDDEKCKNCKACMKLGCPAISQKENGPIIDPSLCTGCGLCAKVCRFDAIVKAGEA